MIEKINLTSLDYAFDSTAVLDNLQRLNYFYGKNGTGKSSLVRAILDQYGDTYDIQRFSGSESLILKDEFLDAISLGQENVEAAKAIQQYDAQIANLDKELLPLAGANNKGSNLNSQWTEATSKYQQLLKAQKHFYQGAARQLKNSHTELTGPNYDKNSFERDITDSKKLSEEELANVKGVLSAHVIDLHRAQAPLLPQISDLAKVKDAVDNILSSTVQSRVVIQELVDHPDKQNFAYEGMRIHNREENEHCAFCGNLISTERRNQLDSYFYDEVEKLQSRILKGLAMIESVELQVNEAFEFTHGNWQSKYEERLQSLQMSSNEHRKVLVNFLKQLEDALETKRESPFKGKDPLDLLVPADFSTIQTSINSLWQENLSYNQQLVNMKESAKTQLRRHFVCEQLSAGKHSQMIQEIKDAERNKLDLDHQINALNDKKQKLLKLKSDEIKKTTSEAQAAKEINQLVRNLGDESFSLEPIKQGGQQNGLYQILGRDAKPRSLKTLSTGELNLLSFLWFRYHLDEVNNSDTRPRIIIFDDPVNSNDDNSQYLILAEIQELTSKDKNDQFFILTHNNHFYVQLRPSSYKNKGVYHLRRADKTSVIKIDSPKDDLSSIYEDLWNELRFLYDHKRLVSVWNCMRRILETYGKFNFANSSPRDTTNLLSTSTDQVLYLSLLKSLHVNSHIGIDTDIDLSGRDVRTLLQTFYDIFASLNATKHFIAYWGEDLATQTK